MLFNERADYLYLGCYNESKKVRGMMISIDGSNVRMGRG